MDFDAFLEIQREFDRRHGWSLDAVSTTRRLEILEREIIGLTGEVGELANIAKKARLDVDRYATASEAFEQIQDSAKTELVDIFIYLLRLLQITDTDITTEYTKKHDVNADRFKRFENDGQD